MHASARPGGRSSWHRRAGRPVRLWMAVLLLVVLFHRWIPETRWLLVHVVTLGLVTNSILVWSQHFTDSLLKNRVPDDARGRQLARIGLLNAGTALLVVGLLTGWYGLVLVASTTVGAAVAWHGASLLRQLRTALPSRFAVTVRYYVTAAFLLPVGAVLGALLAAGPAAGRHARLLLAHEAVNVLGFVGLTVAGTVLTLWPTILRTRLPERSTRVGAAALPVLAGGLVLTGTAALAGSSALAAAGLVVYAAGLGAVVGVLAQAAGRARPADYAGWSVAAGVLWWAATTVAAALVVGLRGFDAAALGQLTVPFVAGFLVQVLLGAMSYLLPVTMGGGPATVRAAHRAINRAGTFRVVVVNLCVLLFALPPGTVPSWVRAVVSLLGAAALFAFVPLMVSAARISVAGRRAAVARRTGEPAPAPEAVAPAAPPRPAREALAGVLVVALGVAAGIAANPAAAGFDLRGGGSGAPATGGTTTVQVSAREGMRFEPATVEVPLGDELVIELTNEDPTNVHDLVLASGTSSGRVAPGRTVTVEAGVVDGSLEGWCSIVGHRSMGMTLDVVAVGADGAPGAAAGPEQGAPGPVPAGTDPAAGADLAAAPGADAEVRSPVLEPVGEGVLEDGRRVHRVDLDVSEGEHEIAPGVRMRAWTYNGRYMGPTLHGEVGDVFEITLRNGGTMGHSVDFHAGTVAPDENMRTVAPGESLVYRFEAVRSGIWLYHCSTAPMSTHVAAGMFGAVVIDPPGLPEVDHDWLLVQNETYLGPPEETAGDGTGVGVDAVVDPARIPGGVPSLTVFNGHATQYLHEPLTARTGERVRIRVLAAGPSTGLSFHVVGGQFDTVHKEGAYLLEPGGAGSGGAQALDLAPAQGGFVELEFTEPGTYPFVNHSLVEAERGARGLIEVTG
ncbi:multicopper oxidase domain-containing protein [Kocuria sp. CH-021]|uniref:multicopper oxidase domain-containing protein n=1 Tax=Kocuria sp. CH-021 TaxID=3406735 RepID=UPI003C78EB0C